jgi:DNA-binding LytR/AlgR family response regulator
MRGQRIVLVDAADILCIRSEGHYTRVCTPSGSQFCNLAISDLEARLDPEQFMRVHRSHIVNLAAVTQLLREEGRLALEVGGGSGEPIPVSRSSAPEVLQRLGVAPVTATGLRTPG